MLTLQLIKITDFSGKTTGHKGGISYRAVIENFVDHLCCLSNIYRDFSVESLGKVEIQAGEISTDHLEDVAGKTLLSVENYSEETTILHFSDGKDITICLDFDGKISISGT